MPFRIATESMDIYDTQDGRASYIYGNLLSFLHITSLLLLQISKLEQDVDSKRELCFVTRYPLPSSYSWISAPRCCFFPPSKPGICHPCSNIHQCDLQRPQICKLQQHPVCSAPRRSLEIQAPENSSTKRAWGQERFCSHVCNRLCKRYSQHISATGPPVKIVGTGGLLVPQR